VGKKQSGITALRFWKSQGRRLRFGCFSGSCSGVSDSRQLSIQHSSHYLGWAMRRGIRGGVTGLLALNFGIVVTLRFVPVSAETFTNLGLLCLQSPPPD